LAKFCSFLLISPTLPHMKKKLLLLAVVALAIPRPAHAVPAKNAHFYGDSLMASLSPSLAQSAATNAGWTFLDRAIPGTAPCDMLPRLRADMASANPPEVVVIEGIGNGSTPCMTGASVGTPQYFARYRADFAAMFAAARPAVVMYVLPPPMLLPGKNQVVNKVMYIGLDEAAKAHVHVVTAGRTALSVNNAFAWTIGGVTVRQPDGTHFTPSGAAKFTNAVVPAVVQLG
jgi:hypothetical protein